MGTGGGVFSRDDHRPAVAAVGAFDDHLHLIALVDGEAILPSGSFVTTGTLEDRLLLDRHVAVL
jgi:hypothetical protein